MFSKANEALLVSTSNSSSVDWECDGESRSWSSSASWSDDVEGEATDRLLQQLQDIDSVLYGEASPKILPLALRQEVAQWTATFPHLRVCGTKLVLRPHAIEEEEGQEEVYASHGEVLEERDMKSDCDQDKLKQQLKHQVMQKLFSRVRAETIMSLETQSARDATVPTLNNVQQREPLLAHRQSARKERVRKQPATQEAELGSILRVSPLPRIGMSRTNVHSSRSSVVLPPIEPLRISSSAIPLSVFGRQTRLNQQKTKVNR